MDVNGIRQALRCGRSGCPCSRGRNVHCPVKSAHKGDDKHPSLTADVRGDRITFNCKTGCSQEDVIAGLTAIKLWPPDQAPSAVATASRGDARRPRKFVKEWPYITEAGETLAWHGRFEFTDADGGKEFLWRREGSDRWGGLGGLAISELPVYNLALALEEPDATVYICEGEKAADACVERFLVAIALGGGASQKEFGTCLDFLRDRDVVLWPDADEPGTALMARVAAILPNARHLAIPKAQPKDDAWDYFNRDHGTVAALEELAALPHPTTSMGEDGTIVTVIPRPGGEIVVSSSGHHVPNPRNFFAEYSVTTNLPGVPRGPYSGHIDVKSISNTEAFRRQLDTVFGKDAGWTGILDIARRELLATFGTASFAVAIDQVPLDWDNKYAIEGICPYGEITMLFAHGETGKTYVALHMVAHLLTGLPWLGHRAYRVPAVLYIDYESNEKVIRRRFHRIMLGMDLESSEYVGGLKYYDPKGIPITGQMAKIRAELRRTGATFIVVDSAALAAGGKPEDAEVALAVCNALNGLGVSVLLISHISGLTLRAGGSETMPFGSVYWHNAVRGSWFLKAAESVDPETKLLGMFNRKMSDDSKPAPLSLEMRFAMPRNQGAVVISKQDRLPAGITNKAGKRALKDEIYDLLETMGAAGIPEIVVMLQVDNLLPVDGYRAEGTDEPATQDQQFESNENVVRTTLNRHRVDNPKARERLFVHMSDGRWTLLSNRTD